MIELIIFDVDGTLAKMFSLQLLDGVQEFFTLVFQSGCERVPKIAIATNQGGVGMRHWMETGGFGKPQKYPTEEEIDLRMKSLVTAFGGDPHLPVYVAYRFRTKEGRWTPAPDEAEENPRWSKEWRKPQPGMLLQAMADAGVSPGQTVFIGDSDDDRNAAAAAGCRFEWAEDFFGRRWSDCKELAAYLKDSRG